MALVFGMCIVGLLAATASAQTGFSSGSTGADGALVFYTPPSGRYAHAMAYDAARHQVVLFGGCCYSDDPWEWDNTRWTLKNPTARPSARYEHAMVYDSSRQVMVLFGGYEPSGYLNDTWEYDGTTWTLKTPASSPDPRYAHAMVYDAPRQRVVLFGGSSPSLGYTNDTWEYDGTTWAQRTPATSPPGRYSHAMAYDSTHQVTVSFGGFSSVGYSNETWLWNGTTWSAPMQTQTFPVVDMSTRPDGIWHYTTIDIPAGVKVSFKSSPANTPVVWLATGAVHIAGEIDLDGANAAYANVDPGNEAPGGPGGGAGGLGGRRFDVSGSYAGTPGEGPGGGLPGTSPGQYGGSGGYGTPGSDPLGGPVYGNRLVRPLLGGSGGGGGASSDASDGGNGGGGGGAILIASSGTIQMSGSIHANGGYIQYCGAACGGYGSGGAIRLVANRIEGSGSLSAYGYGGGQGRIRLEAFFVPSSLNVNPLHTAAVPLTTGLANAGLIRITSVAG